MGISVNENRLSFGLQFASVGTLTTDDYQMDLDVAP